MSRWTLIAAVVFAAACSGGSTTPGDPEELCGPLYPNGRCADGFVCYGGQCLPAADMCSATNTAGLCAAGQTCLEGTCYPNADMCGTSNPYGRCATGFACRGGQCLPDSAFCSATNPTGLCADISQTCVEGVCRAQTELCSVANPTGVCETGETCRGGQCLDDDLFCSGSNPTCVCADTAQTCVAGSCCDAAALCSPTNPTGVCASPLTCINGACAVSEPCSGSAPQGYCDTGETCIDGSCTDNGDLCSATNTTGVCASGNTCIDGSCTDDDLLCSAGQPAGLCPSGETCFEDACVDDGDLCAQANPTGLCTGLDVCLDGSCVDPSQVCSSTNPTGACAGTDVCFEGDCLDPNNLCSPSNTGGLCPSGESCDDTGHCVPAGNCDCDAGETCVDGTCRADELLCSAANPTGLCESGFDCVAGVCEDAGAGCSATNPTGICPVGEICQAGDCVALDGGDLCDDDNACTLDFFDFARNRCDHQPQDVTCSDGNACTSDSCSTGVCRGTPIPSCVEPPGIDAYVTPTNVPVLDLSGTKPSGSSIWIDGLEAVSESPDTIWDVTLNLAEGENIYVVHSENGGQASETVTVRVVYDATAPETTLSPAGGTYLTGVTVTVASNEPALVHYTTDGSLPDENAPAFESVKEMRVFDDTVLSFRAQDMAGNWETDVVTATFEITGEDNRWEDGPVLVEARTHAGAAFLGDAVYVVGGSDGLAPQAGAYEYDLTSQSWTTLPSLPDGRAQVALIALDGVLYALGGENVGVPKRTVYTFDPAVDSAWNNDPAENMPSTRYGLAVVEYGGELYAFGGKTSSGVIADVEVFTPGSSGSWTNVVPGMPRARYAFGAVEHDGLIYLVGGEDDDGNPIAEVDVYDPLADPAEAWSQVADLPTPRSFLGVAISRNIGLVDGGYTGIVAAGGRTLGGAASAMVEEYIIDDDTWRTRKPLDAPLHSAAVVAVDDTGRVDALDRQVWLVGGQIDSTISDSVTYFTLDQDYVARLEDAPEAHFMHAAAALDGRIYLVGGRSEQESDLVWVFDPETQTFDALPPITDPLQNGLVVAAVGDKVYAIGGADLFGNSVAVMRAYDPVLGAWDDPDPTPMPSARRDAAVAVTGHEIWVIGGYDDGATQKVEVYDALDDTWRTEVVLPEARTGAQAIAHDGYIYVFGGLDASESSIDTILRFDGLDWSTRSGSIPASYGSIAVFGDQVAVLAGRDDGALTQRVWSYDLGGALALPRWSRLLAPFDHSAAAVLNGDVYLFGGNAAQDPPFGPTGEVLVQKVSGQCLNGVADGREIGVDQGGGCGMPGMLDTFESNRLNQALWPVTSNSVSHVTNAQAYSGSYSMQLGYGDSNYGSIESATFDTAGCSRVYYNIRYRRQALESNDYLYLDYWTGSSWTYFTYLSGSNDTTWYSYGSSTTTSTARHNSFKVRLRSLANSTGEYWYLDDVYFGCAPMP